MSKGTLDDRGRITLPREVREAFGESYHIVKRPDVVTLIPIADDPLSALREEFADVEASREELRESALEEAAE